MNPTIILFWKFILHWTKNQIKTFTKPSVGKIVIGAFSDWKNCHRSFFWYHQNPSRSDCWKRPPTSTINHHQKTNQTTSIDKSGSVIVGFAGTVYSVLETGSFNHSTGHIASLASGSIPILLAVEVKTEKEETPNIAWDHGPDQADG